MRIKEKIKGTAKLTPLTAYEVAINYGLPVGLTNKLRRGGVVEVELPDETIKQLIGDGLIEYVEAKPKKETKKSEVDK